MIVDLTSGPMGKKLDRAVLKFAKNELVAPSNDSCSFDFLQMRCEPSAMCNLDYQKGDMTPGQACRLISTMVPAKASAAPVKTGCSWNNAQLRCENNGECHPEIWRWVRRELRRRTWFVRRLSKLYLVTMYTSSLTALKTVSIQARAAAKRARVVAAALAQDFSLGMRRTLRLARQLLLKMKDPKSFREELQATVNPYTSRLAAWHRTIVPMTKPVLTKCSDHIMHVGSKLSIVAREKQTQLKVAVKAFKKSAANLITGHSLAKTVEQVMRTTFSLRRTSFELNWDQVNITGQQLKIAAVAAFRDTQVAAKNAAHRLDAIWHRVVLTTFETLRRWRHLLKDAKTAYNRGVVAEAEGLDAMCRATAALSPALLKLGEQALQRVRCWYQRVRDRFTGAVTWLGAKGVQLRVLGLEFLKDLKDELDRTEDHEKVDFCVAIPAVKRASVRSWQVYSKLSAKKTASLIRDSIVHHLMV